MLYVWARSAAAGWEAEEAADDNDEEADVLLAANQAAGRGDRVS